MAKKKIKKKARAKVKTKVRSAKRNPVGAPRGKRKELYTSDRMTHVVDLLREQAARLSGLARAMDDAGVKNIDVDGHTMLYRGLNQIDNFTDNATRAIREERTAMRSD